MGKQIPELIGIVVPVWNKVAVTAFFLGRAHRWVKRYLADLVVVDNGSIDGTPQLLETWGKHYGTQLIVVRNEENRGFGPGNNQGVKATSAGIIILMNNDVEIRGDFIQPILEHLEEQPRSIVCVNLVDWDGGWNSFANRAVVVPYAEGWLLAMRREIWEELGGFDERYVPCYYEDMDLSMTAHSKDIELCKLSLPLIHRMGTTSSQLAQDGKLALKQRRLFREKWDLED